MPSNDMKNIFTGIAQNTFYPCKNNGKESFMPIVLEEIFQGVQAAGFPMP